MANDEGYAWDEKRPTDGQPILAFSVRLGEWLEGTYFEDGIDGIIEWAEGGPCEIEEYGIHTITRWKPAST